MNENDSFLYKLLPKEPKAGEMLYCVPVYTYTTAPTELNRMISAIVTAQRAFGKSLGFFISAMKDGKVIWPMNV